MNQKELFAQLVDFAEELIAQCDYLEYLYLFYWAQMPDNTAGQITENTNAGRAVLADYRRRLVLLKQQYEEAEK